MMNSKALLTLVHEALDDMKAMDIRDLDIQALSSVAENMIICSGRSDRHVKSIAEKVLENVKKHGVQPLSVEGKEHGEWILIDLNDVIIHVMQPHAREFYDLEGLWSVAINTSEAAE